MGTLSILPPVEPPVVTHVIDTDGDGVSDALDLCPNESGIYPTGCIPAASQPDPTPEPLVTNPTVLEFNKLQDSVTALSDEMARQRAIMTGQVDTLAAQQEADKAETDAKIGAVDEKVDSLWDKIRDLLNKLPFVNISSQEAAEAVTLMAELDALPIHSSIQLPLMEEIDTSYATSSTPPPHPLVLLCPLSHRFLRLQPMAITLRRN